MSKRSASSQRWLKRQSQDVFVKRAQQEGWRSRAVYKLQELDQRQRLIRPGQAIVDLGAAPGGWSQYAARKLAGRGQVYALDILPMDPLPGVVFIQDDFTEETALRALQRHLHDKQADLVISDLAPNVSGMRAVDQPRAMHLAELALEFAGQLLATEGALVVKLFQGEGFDGFVAACRSRFSSVKLCVPEASRRASREVYLVARNHCL